MGQGRGNMIKTENVLGYVVAIVGGPELLVYLFGGAQRMTICGCR